MKLELTAEQITFILQSLAQQPYSQVVGLIEEILKQTKEHQKEGKK
jgi:hypothetical protein